MGLMVYVSGIMLNTCLTVTACVRQVCVYFSGDEQSTAPQLERIQFVPNLSSVSISFTHTHCVRQVLHSLLTSA